MRVARVRARRGAWRWPSSQLFLFELLLCLSASNAEVNGGEDSSYASGIDATIGGGQSNTVTNTA
jgi:hypothetical protein